MEERVKNTIKNLKCNGFDVQYCETKQEAQQKIEEYIAEGASVGIGGSVTLQELGIKDILERKHAVILDHNKPGFSPEEVMKIRRQQLSADVFCCSSNAITVDGKLYNVDGAGNRVAAMTFGPNKVLVVAGINKIVADLEAAELRVKEVAAIRNNIRLQRDNPCVKLKRCIDCSSPQRICNIRSIMDKRPMLTDMTIILVDEVLGY